MSHLQFQLLVLGCIVVFLFAFRVAAHYTSEPDDSEENDGDENEKKKGRDYTKPLITFGGWLKSLPPAVLVALLLLVVLNIWAIAWSPVLFLHLWATSAWRVFMIVSFLCSLAFHDWESKKEGKKHGEKNVVGRLGSSIIFGLMVLACYSDILTVIAKDNGHLTVTVPSPIGLIKSIGQTGPTHRVLIKQEDRKWKANWAKNPATKGRFAEVRNIPSSDIGVEIVRADRVMLEFTLTYRDYGTPKHIFFQLNRSISKVGTSSDGVSDKHGTWEILSVVRNPVTNAIDVYNLSQADQNGEMWAATLTAASPSYVDVEGTD